MRSSICLSSICLCLSYFGPSGADGERQHRPNWFRRKAGVADRREHKGSERCADQQCSCAYPRKIEKGKRSEQHYMTLGKIEGADAREVVRRSVALYRE